MFEKFKQWSQPFSGPVNSPVPAVLRYHSSYKINKNHTGPGMDEVQSFDNLIMLMYINNIYNNMPLANSSRAHWPSN